MTEREDIRGRGRTFRGVIVPTGPSGQAKTVIMYVMPERTMSRYGDNAVITPDCVSLRELREEIDKFKADLDWLYEKAELRLKKMLR